MNSALKTLLGNAVAVLLGTAFVLLALEVALRLLPVATAPDVQPPTAGNPIQRYAADTPFTWSIGWNFAIVARGRTNAQGFVASYDYDAAADTPLVAVIGDSYIEALGVPFDETVTGRLQQALGSRGRAYAFAQSGSPLSQYVAYARHACATYRPQRLVFSVVGNDFDESVYAHRKRNGIFHLHPQADQSFRFELTPLPAPGLAERIARRSALALYLFRNLSATGGLIEILSPAKARASTPAPYVGNTSADASPERVAEGERVIGWFLDQLAGSLCVKPQDIVIAVDAMRPQIYEGPTTQAAKSSYFGLMRSHLLKEAAARGMKAVDLETAFRADFAANGRRFEPAIDNHWNAYGHAVAARAILDALGNWPAPLR